MMLHLEELENSNGAKCSWDNIRYKFLHVKADFQSLEFSERAEFLLYARENVVLKLNRKLRLSDLLLSKIPPARKTPLTGNQPLRNLSSTESFQNFSHF